MKFRKRFSLMSLAVLSVLTTSSVIPAYGDLRKSKVCNNTKSNGSNFPASVEVKTLLDGFVDSKKFEIALENLNKSHIKDIVCYEQNQLKAFTVAFNSMAKLKNISQQEALKYILKMQRLEVNFGNFLYTLYKRRWIYDLVNGVNSTTPDYQALLQDLRQQYYGENTNMAPISKLLLAIRSLKHPNEFFDSKLIQALNSFSRYKSFIASMISNPFLYVSPEKFDKNGNRIKQGSDKDRKKELELLKKRVVSLLKFE